MHKDLERGHVSCLRARLRSAGEVCAAVSLQCLETSDSRKTWASLAPISVSCGEAAGQTPGAPMPHRGLLCLSALLAPHTWLFPARQGHSLLDGNYLNTDFVQKMPMWFDFQKLKPHPSQKQTSSTWEWMELVLSQGHDSPSRGQTRCDILIEIWSKRLTVSLAGRKWNAILGDTSFTTYFGFPRKRWPPAAPMPKSRPIPPADPQGRTSLVQLWSASSRRVSWPLLHWFIFWKLPNMRRRGADAHWGPRDSSGHSQGSHGLPGPFSALRFHHDWIWPPHSAWGAPFHQLPLPVQPSPLRAWSREELPKRSCLPAGRPLPRSGKLRKPWVSQVKQLLQPLRCQRTPAWPHAGPPCSPFLAVTCALGTSWQGRDRDMRPSPELLPGELPNHLWVVLVLALGEGLWWMSQVTRLEVDVESLHLRTDINKPVAWGPSRLECCSVCSAQADSTLLTERVQDTQIIRGRSRCEEAWEQKPLHSSKIKLPWIH